MKVTRIAEGYDPGAGTVKKENRHRSIEISVDAAGTAGRTTARIWAGSGLRASGKKHAENQQREEFI
jgi:hypothetical protein